MKNWVVMMNNAYFYNLKVDEYGIFVECARDLELASILDKETAEQVCKMLKQTKFIQEEKIKCKIFQVGDDEK